MKIFIVINLFIICIANADYGVRATVGKCYHSYNLEFIIPKDNWKKVIKIGDRNYLYKHKDTDSKNCSYDEQNFSAFDTDNIEGPCPSFLKGN